MRLVTSLLAAFFPPLSQQVADLSIGRRAVVRGKVVARDFIDSTLTGERCVYYRYSVEEWRKTHMAGLAGMSDGYWALARFDEAIVEFYLQDEAGDRIIIAPQRANVELGRAPRHVDMGISGQRAQELILRPGDLVEIQGMVTSVVDLFDADRDYRSGARRKMMTADGDKLTIRGVRGS